MPERPDSDREVLTSLPRTRPVRRSSKRGERPGADGADRPSAKRVAPRKPRAAKAAAKPAAVTPAPAARAARPRATTKAAAKATPKATPKGTPKATPKATPAAEPPVRPRAAPQRKIPAAGYAAPDTRGADPTASPATELITTTIQAAAELTQIGLTVGRQTLQSMLERLPKP